MLEHVRLIIFAGMAGGNFEIELEYRKKLNQDSDEWGLSGRSAASEATNEVVEQTQAPEHPRSLKPVPIHVVDELHRKPPTQLPNGILTLHNLP